MPAQRSKSAFAAAMGSKYLASFNKHKDEDTVLGGGGFSNLPGGINNGVARLKSAEIRQIPKGRTDEGKWQFFAVATVLRPREHLNDNTFISIPLYDTPTRARKTFDENFDYLLKQLRVLGVDTASIDPHAIEDSLQELVDQAPCFKFRTWQGEPATEGKYAGKPALVNHYWDNGLCDEPVDDDDGVEDGTAEATAPSRNGRTQTGGGRRQEVAEAFNEFEESQAEEGDAEDTVAGDDLDALAEKAEVDDDDDPEVLDARDKLLAAATDAGIDDDTAARTEPWSALVDLIREAQEAGSEAAVEEEEEEPAPPPRSSPTGAARKATATKAPAKFQQRAGAAPAKAATPVAGNAYFARPTDPRTKRPARTPVEVEVTKVDARTKTVDCRNLDDGKTLYRGVAWSALSEN